MGKIIDSPSKCVTIKTATTVIITWRYTTCRNVSKANTIFLPQTYKPPMYQDIPEEMNVTLYEGDQNLGRGVLGSKATGEPATHMGVSVAFAIRHALDAVKQEIGQENGKWYPLGW